MIEEIRFYHLTKHQPEDALKKLLPLAQTRYGNIVLYVETNEMAQWNKILWDTGTSFLAHGSDGDCKRKETQHIQDYASRQPIYINDDGNNPNHAYSLFCLTSLPTQEILEKFKLICLIFSEQNQHLVRQARESWKYCQAQDYPSIYYSQDASGKWQKKLQEKLQENSQENSQENK